MREGVVYLHTACMIYALVIAYTYVRMCERYVDGYKLYTYIYAINNNNNNNIFLLSLILISYHTYKINANKKE